MFSRFLSIVTIYDCFQNLSLKRLSHELSLSKVYHEGLKTINLFNLPIYICNFLTILLGVVFTVNININCSGLLKTSKLVPFINISKQF